MGKYALSSSSFHAGKQGRPPRASAALGRRPWASGTAGVRGKRGRATWEVDSLPRFGKMVARRGGSTAAGGSRRWRASGWRHGARRRAGPGGKGGGDLEDPRAYLASGRGAAGRGAPRWL